MKTCISSNLQEQKCFSSSPTDEANANDLNFYRWLQANSELTGSMLYTMKMPAEVNALI